MFTFQLKKDFFALLKELKVSRNSSWSEIKRSGDHDQRYKAVESSSRREDWFREYQSKHLDETTSSSTEVQRNFFFQKKDPNDLFLF